MLVMDRMILTSFEYNGDMYYDGNGEKAVGLLSADNVINISSFNEVLTQFNQKCFGYSEGGKFQKSETRHDNDVIDLSGDYIGKWFSDYLYIKNASHYDLQIICKDGERYIMPSGEVAWFHFGSFSGSTGGYVQALSSASGEDADLSKLLSDMKTQVACLAKNIEIIEAKLLKD